MILNFVWPSSAQYTGGVVALYEFANGLARRGHEVHFVHGPASPYRVDRLDDLTWFTFDDAVVHHLVDSLDDPSLVPGDVVFSPFAPSRLGHPAVIVQGHGMVPLELERDTLRFPGLKICVAQWLVEIGVSYGVPREQLVHVPCGMDHDLFRVITPFDQRPIDVALLFNKHPAKAWDIGCAAMVALHERRPDLRVEVFGIVPPDRSIPAWMHFQQGLDRQHLVTDIYNRSKVFVQPSWYEGFGLTAIEAMATGCALVTTDNGGSLDYALPGETALVVPPGDAAGLAAAVDELLSDDARRRQVSAAGAAYVRRFTWTRAAEQAEAHLVRYATDPAAFQHPAGPDRPPERVLTAAHPMEVPAQPEPDRAPAPRPVPDEGTFVFNIVWTGVVFRSLQYFVASQIAHSRSRFRFVVNGCPPSQIALMEAFRADHPEQVVEVLVVSTDDMVAHGVALDRVRAERHDGDHFCLIDPDIKATAPFVADFAALAADHAAVTSGKEVWTDDNLVPEGNFGVAGEHFFSRDGFVFGSPHLAIYHRAALDATCERWGVGLGSAGPELRDDAKARLVEMGHPYTVYDTAKIVNVLLQADGHRLAHRDLPQLIHIGGLAHYISPPEQVEGVEEEPTWTLYPEMAARHEVTRYTADLLTRLLAGQEAPGLPTELDHHLADRLAMVRREVIDLVQRYRPPALAAHEEPSST